MQNKNIKYFLLIGVSVVWGIIVFKVIENITRNEMIPTAKASKSENRINDNLRIEGYDLLVNYDDPFNASVTNIEPGPSLITKESKLPEIKTTSTAPVDISFIKYNGLLSNSKTHKTTAIIIVHGKEEIVTSNTRIGDILINTIKKNKISITYRGDKFSIQREY